MRGVCRAVATLSNSFLSPRVHCAASLEKSWAEAAGDGAVSADSAALCRHYSSGASVCALTPAHRLMYELERNKELLEMLEMPGISGAAAVGVVRR